MTAGAISPAPVRAGRAWAMLGILTLVYIVSFIDRQILSILSESIKADLKLSDAQLGFLYGTAFAIFYALFGIPLGRLADSWHRGWLIALGLVGWSLMTGLSGFATSFVLLALARTGVGVGEAGTSPAAYSLISEWFPAQRRATALAIYASGLYIGMGLSLPIGGAMLAYWTNHYPTPSLAPLGFAAWQATFVMLAIPGVAIALLVLFVRDPSWAARKPLARPMFTLISELAAIVPPFTLLTTARLPGELKWNLFAIVALGAAAAALTALIGDGVQWSIYAVGIYAILSWVQVLRHRDPETYRLIFAAPVTIWLIVAFGGIAFVTYSVSFWSSPYALRTFYAGPSAPAQILRGRLAVQEVAFLVGAGSTIGSALGVVCGGVLADRWWKRNHRGRLYTVMGALLISMPLAVVQFTTNRLGLFFVLVPFTTFASSSWTGAALATVQSLVRPRMQATAGATFLLGMTLIGLALGPYSAGKIAGVAGLRVGILSVCAISPVLLGLLWWCSQRLPARLETGDGAMAQSGAS